MIDTEFSYGFRFRYIMAEKSPVVTPYDQDMWVDTYKYGIQDGTQLIRAFTPLRRVNLELLQTVDRKLFEKPAQHPEYGTITVAMMIPHLAGHDTNHLQQIRERDHGAASLDPGGIQWLNPVTPDPGCYFVLFLARVRYSASTCSWILATPPTTR